MQEAINVVRCKLCKQLGHSIEQCPVAKILSKYKPKIKQEIVGSSPPEVFVGSWNWPYVYYGILAPNEYGNTEIFSMPELWYEENFSIEQILSYRARMIYSRKQGNIKKINDRQLSIMQELAMAIKHVDVSVLLKKKPTIKTIQDLHWPLIGNPSPLAKLEIESNPKVPSKTEKLVNDYDARAREAIIELYQAGIEISNIIKLLSIGLLGVKADRHLVPSRWAVTAVDDTISKWLLEKVKSYSVIENYQVFHAEYLGNHYEILLMPFSWSFEVMEGKLPGCVWNPRCPLFMAIDYEGFNGRKTYASNVTGAYYANRLAIAEYLARIKRQAACLVLREVKQSYYAACGVGILREACRDALRKKPEIFYSLDEALNAIARRLELPAEKFFKHSWLLKKIVKQKSLKEFFI